MNLRPNEGFVLVEVLKEDTVTQSGFALPDSAEDKPSKGTVIEGEGFTKGDVIVFRRYKGHELKENGKNLVFVEVKDIVGYYDG